MPHRYARRIINPYESFTLVPSDTVPSGSSQRTPTLYVYRSSSHASEKASFSHLEKLQVLYTLFLPHQTKRFKPSWWPWTAHPTISLYSGFISHSPPFSDDPSTAVAVQRATIVEPWFAASQCSVGSIYETAKPLTSIPNPGSTSYPNLRANSTLTPTSSPPPPYPLESTLLTISSGLGHGLWYDEILPRLLLPQSYSHSRSTSTSEKAPPRQPQKTLLDSTKPTARTTATWHASPTGWTHEDAPDEIEWAGLGRPRNGAIMVCDSKQVVLALYLPRGSTLVLCSDADADADAGGAGGVGGESGLGVGRLGICADLSELEDEQKEAVGRHLLVVAVGIEQQILRCRGFRGRYHGGWA